MSWLDVVLILGSALRLAVPLLFGALAGLYSERAGIFDIGLEGKMLAAAFAAGAVTTLVGTPLAGLLAAVVTSVALALLHGYAAINQRGNQIVSGVAINILAAGATALFSLAIFGQGGGTPQLEPAQRFGPLRWPFAEEIGRWPIVGPLYAQLLSGHYVFVYVALAAVPFTAWVLGRTRFGLRLRAVGENPAAVDAAGISVAATRYRALLCTGLLCGLAGAYMSTAQSAGFTNNMTAGKGFMALAALIFANWKPWRVLAACMIFGLLDALSIRLQGVELPGIGEVPVQAIQALPYILTVVLLAGFIGKAVPPRAGGVPYVKERR